MFAAYVLLELCEFFEKRAGNENDQNPLKGANNTNRSQFHTFLQVCYRFERFNGHEHPQNSARK